MPLPEKSYFTANEVVDRWAGQRVGLAALVDYARQDLER